MTKLERELAKREDAERFGILQDWTSWANLGKRETKSCEAEPFIPELGLMLP